MDINAEQGQKMKDINDDSQVWYQQFWPWFVFALPATVVVAGIVTVLIAIRHSDNLVVDNYYKEGLAINQYLEQDKYALKNNLVAKLHINANTQLSLTLSELSDVSDHLLLHWQHPTNKKKDFSTVLTQRSNHHYEASLNDRISGRWYLTLSAFSSAGDTSPWRLKTELFLPKDVRKNQQFTLKASP